MNATETLSTSQSESHFFHNNMSLITNLFATAIFFLGFFTPVFSLELKAIGLFSLSGAITNWLAVHMLFEKVPGLYGSGIIPLKFEEFKRAIHTLIMTEFFTSENLQNFFSKESQTKKITKELKVFISQVNYESLYEKLLNSILESPVGPMLSMVGGAKILEPAKPHFIETMKKTIEDLGDKATQHKTFQNSLEKAFSLSEIKPKIERVILNRLNELTPQMVKEIIENMIKKHLGWLVVWGGVFGGLIGLLSTFF